MSIEGTANTEYASLSGKIRTFVVDKTLTISGACADAKATGEKIDRAFDDVVATAEEVAESYLNGKVDPAVAAAMDETLPDKMVEFIDATVSFGGMAADASETRTLIEKRAKVAMGSYQGNGNKGANFPNTLTLDFKPQVVFLNTGVSENYNAQPNYYILTRPSTKYQLPDANDKGVVAWSDNGVSWYTTNDPACQFNTTGVTYHYIAIG